LIAYVAKFNDIVQDQHQSYELKVKAAYPEKYLNKLDHKFMEEKKDNKFGISGLAIGIYANSKNNPTLVESETINIGNVQNHIDQNDKFGRAYIENNKNTNSQLSVPILLANNGVKNRIGVITLEHTNLNAFSEDIVNIVEQFAQYVAIAYSKQNQIQELNRLNSNLNENKSISDKLYTSLETIVKKPPGLMLYEAIIALREAFKIKDVFIMHIPPP
jgi:GAF domain-containing protein